MVSIKRVWAEIPKLPFSALVFYLLVVLLWKIGIIPAPIEIVSFLETLYTNYGFVGLFIAAFLEGIVYLGLYFPGSFIIALSVFLSDGSFVSLALISLVVSLAWTITSSIDYLLGRFVPFQRKLALRGKKFSKGFIFSFIHQNVLAFYFFHRGIEKKTPWELLVVFPLMFIWGLFVVSILSLFRESLKKAVESSITLVLLIVLWLAVAFILEHKRNN